VCAITVMCGVTPGKWPSVWWLDAWCAELGLWDGRYVWRLWPDGHSLVWGDLCHIWAQGPWCMLCTAHSPMCLSNEPCTYVQGIATRSYMHHPVTVKRSYVLKLSFERGICCLSFMLFMSVHICGFYIVKPTNVQGHSNMTRMICV
jgi:hypothetical protein